MAEFIHVWTSETYVNEHKCQICSSQGMDVTAAKVCQECDEMLCLDCSTIHKSQKVSRSHRLIDANEILDKKTDNMGQEKKNCEPCSSQHKYIDAVMYCEDCEEFLCKDCSTVHSSQKLTKLHKLLPVDQIVSTVFCEPCLEREINVQAVKACKMCEEKLCEKCVTAHKFQKITKSHELVDISNYSPVSKSDKPCEPCKENKKDNAASEVCVDCEEFLCITCAAMHKTQKATKNHKLIKAYDIPTTWCDPCSEKGEQIAADEMCQDCEEALCSSCITQHKSQKATKKHELQELTLLISALKTCDPCEKIENEVIIAVKYCEECVEYYCNKCTEMHLVQKMTKKHKLVDAKLAKNADDEISKLKGQESDEEQRMEVKKDEVMSTLCKEDGIPGKPKTTDMKSDSISIHWMPPKTFGNSSYYRLRYKEEGKQWQFYNENIERAVITIENLQAETKYSFQVRAVINDEEGPYSPESGQISTKRSLASKLLPFTQMVRRGQPSIHQLISTENRDARNERAKTRKFELGQPPLLGKQEKTILLVGATGSGKSTLVDGIINYVSGVSWKDPYRFTLVNLEQEERKENQALSQTEWITCYTINPEEGSRLDYCLKIIDTPGFGDTRGLERDQEIVKQIKELFTAQGSKGVVFIDAVCFLIKAPDARLTPVQKYIFMSILSLFGQDIGKNICTLITFADGDKPPVLAAMTEAELPYDSWYVFNNSGLFASNEDSKSSLAPMFWDMGNKSFKRFFDCLDQLPTKSLQQTQQVLHERERLEITIQNLQPQVDAGLNKVHQLKQEVDILKKHEKDIKDNKDFEYEVEEIKQVRTELPKGKHTTNCLQCNVTCHNNCVYANNDDKKLCRAMVDGKCTVCEDKCSWQQHANTPFIFSFEPVKVKKTYAEKQKMYKQAGEKKVSHEEIINRMVSELDELNESIQVMMEQVNECNNVLKNIALRPNPLTMVEHIDLMIEGEKMEKKDGFMNRIQVLQLYRKKAEIHKDVSKLQEEYITTARSRSGNVPGDQKAIPHKAGFFRRFTDFFTR